MISQAVKMACEKSKKIHKELKAFDGNLHEKQLLEQRRKDAKKELRRIQRCEAAENRHKIYSDIMKANCDDKQLFFRLVKIQREGKMRKLSKLIVNDVHLKETDEIRNGWVDYFSELSKAKENSNFDENYKCMIESDVRNIEKLAEAEEISSISISTNTVKELIDEMKNNKSPDADGIMCEHLKFGGTQLLEHLQALYLMIIKEQKIPEKFKNGVITPIYKKQNKPIFDPNSYRRITVTSIIGKVFEKLHLNSVIDQLEYYQSKLQRGFTKGVSPLYAAFLLTEAIAESQDNKKALYAAFLDASKAFDVVWHNSMLRKLYDVGLKGTDWILMKDWYSNMTSQVKWEGGLSLKFNEQQGVRQGGIWSPSAYKAFINPVLKTFEEKAIGFRIGSIHLASPTCADDELLLSENKYELVTLVKVQEKYANEERYILSDQKSKVMVFNQKQADENLTDVWHLNGRPIELVESYTHIGIERTSKQQTNLSLATDEAIKTARRTAYSLMGVGFHGVNGINPMVGIQLWEIYIKPRLLYGLECLPLRTQDILKINQYQRKVMKHIMHLPERTADAGVYVLSGQLPIEADLDRKYLTQLMNILAGEGVERELACRQLAVKELVYVRFKHPDEI